MEILHKPAALPGLHNSAPAAAWSGWSSAGGVGGSSYGRNCRPSLPLPKIPSWARGLGLGFPSAPRTVWKCSSSVRRDGLLLSITACHAPRMAAPCRGRRAVIVAVSSLNGGYDSSVGGEGNLDLEMEVFEFMQQSGKPDAFPTRRDLVSAGRPDLAKAIAEEGGWLAAGWDEEGGEEEGAEMGFEGLSSDVSFATDEKGTAAAAVVEVEEKGRSRPKLSRRKYKARSLKRNSSSSSAAEGKSSRVRIGERSGGIAERRLNGANVVREVENAVDDNDARRKGNQLMMLNTDEREPVEDFSILERPSYNGKSAGARGTKQPSSKGTRNADLQVLERISSLLSFTEELTLTRPQGEHQRRRSLGQDSARNDFAKSAVETTFPNESFSDNDGFQTETLLEVLRGENSGTSPRDAVTDVAAQPKRKRRVRKKVKAHVVDDKSTTDELNGDLDLLHEIFYEGELLMLDMSLRGGESSFGASLVEDSESVQSRLHSLAASLVDTRAALQSGREALWQTGNDEVHQEALAEFIDAEDTLEFRENAIMQARNELITTRAQVAALEGNSEVEMIEARKILEEKNLLTERARSASRRLRAACVVWPNHANEVFLTGSFNGWNGQIKMEKSNAGVFAVSLPLYPGKYEIKFVVDGSWRVDTLRPIVYVGGFENNILSVS